MEETIVVSKEISADPQEVWDLITDLANMGRWSPENDGGKWLSKDGGPKLGARFMGKNSWQGTNGLPLSRLRNSLNRNDSLSK